MLLRKLAVGLVALSMAAVSAATVGPGSGTPAAASQQSPCSTIRPNAVQTYLTWTSNWAGPQWVDISLSNNGFVPGTFISAGPIPAGVGEFSWDGLDEGKLHYVRVNTLTANGWWPSGTGTFTTGYCAEPATGGGGLGLDPLALPPYGTYLIAGDGTFLGEFNCSRFASDDVANRFGDYGSKFSSTSIFNEFGSYGGRFGSYSPYNEFTSTPPALVWDGRIIGYLTLNRFHAYPVDTNLFIGTYLGRCA